MYNGWTNWETWVTVTHLEDIDDHYEAGELRELIETGFGIGLLEDLKEQFIGNALDQVNYEEIARAFADEQEPDDENFPLEDWLDED